MNAMRRFLLALKGRRAPIQDDDGSTFRPWWWPEDEDASLKFIRAEARLRAHEDLMAAIDTKPQKKLTVITTADIGGSKKSEGK